MSNGPSPKQSWNTKSLALYGAGLGILVGIIHAYVHAFWSPPVEDDVLRHVVTRMILFAGAGASLLAGISAIRNWLGGRP
jgi:hypothetical protein